MNEVKREPFLCFQSPFAAHQHNVIINLSALVVVEQVAQCFHYV